MSQKREKPTGANIRGVHGPVALHLRAVRAPGNTKKLGSTGTPKIQESWDPLVYNHSPHFESETISEALKIKFWTT